MFYDSLPPSHFLSDLEHRAVCPVGAGEAQSRVERGGGVQADDGRRLHGQRQQLNVLEVVVLARRLAAAVEDNCLGAVKGRETLFVPTLCRAECQVQNNVGQGRTIAYRVTGARSISRVSAVDSTRDVFPSLL